MPPAGQFDPNLTYEVTPQFEQASLAAAYFFSGNIWPHKNHSVLLNAFKIFRTSRRRANSLVLSIRTDGCAGRAARHEP
jgi:hypothetical protein